MKSALKRILPQASIRAFRFVLEKTSVYKVRFFGRPRRKGESSKARERRVREGFFDSYCLGSGLDIGYGGDLLTGSCRGWDIEDGDAQYLLGLDDEVFDFVYSSHTLEHVDDPFVAIQSWWRVLKPCGYLLLYIPHRDLYEKKKVLPSRWNGDHKHFFLPFNDDPPDTLGLLPLIERALANFEVVYIRECLEGWSIPDPLIHSNGEYSIEAVIRKLPH